MCCSYDPNRINVPSHLCETGKTLDMYSAKYENALLKGDFNVASDERNIKAFCNQYKLKYLNKEPTCFKNVDKPCCNDLFLSNKSKCFEDSLTFETGLSDFHKLIVTAIKTNMNIFL